jgi:Glycosyltransferase family 25 (LPS biosynthesis protein)
MRKSYINGLLLTAVLVGLVVLYMIPSDVQFPPTLVINLDKRTDRLEEINEEFKEWPVPLERIPAIKMTPGVKGCYLSHLKCIRIAKERNYPWVLILEDDCILMKNAREKFVSLLPYLWKHRDRWDMFNGGVTYITESRLIDYPNTLFEAKGYAANFYLVHKGVYDRILKYDQPTEPIDVVYKKYFRIITTVPYLAKQRPSVSDLESHANVLDKTPHDYTNVFNESEDKLKKSIGI